MMASQHVIVQEDGTPIEDNHPSVGSHSSSSESDQICPDNESEPPKSPSAALMTMKHHQSEECNFLCFFNSRSGGQNGEAVGNALREHIGPDCVFDLAEVSKKLWRPEDKLRLWKEVPDLKIIVCGGDGTMGWIFSSIDRVGAPPGKFPMAMMPLGTGNDLSRTFRWGYGFKDRMLKLRFIEKVRTSMPSQLDRWMISVVPYEPIENEELIRGSHLPPTFTIHQYHSQGQKGETVPLQSITVEKEGQSYSQRLENEVAAMHEKGDFLEEDEEPVDNILRPVPSASLLERHNTWESYDGVFCNYFSLGVDAIAASAFHEHRETHPEQFTGRIANQLMYVRKGFPAAGGCFSSPPPPLRSFMELKVLNKGATEFETVRISRKLRGLIILNLQSYGGGRNLWGKMDSSHTNYVKPSCSDGLVEVVGVSNIYNMGCIMGLNKVGVHARKLAQAQEIVLKIKSSVHMQIDGEPWLQPASTVHIKCYGQSTCLVPLKHYPIEGANNPKQGENSGGFRESGAA